MVGPGLMLSMVALSASDPSLLMSLPVESIMCSEVRPPEPPPPLPSRTRACVEIDGVPGPECRSGGPVPLPETTPARILRTFAATSLDRDPAPNRVEVVPFAHAGRAADGHERPLEEPPRAS